MNWTCWSPSGYIISLMRIVFSTVNLSIMWYFMHNLYFLLHVFLVFLDGLGFNQLALFILFFDGCLAGYSNFSNHQVVLTLAGGVSSKDDFINCIQILILLFGIVTKYFCNYYFLSGNHSTVSEGQSNAEVYRI